MATRNPIYWRTYRSLPTDLDRERIRAKVETAMKCLRDGLHASVLDVQLSGLQGASIQRVYVKLLLRELARWLAGTVTRGNLVAYAHHVDSQDGHAHSSSRSMTDKAAAAMLRALARSIE